MGTKRIKMFSKISTEEIVIRRTASKSLFIFSLLFTVSTNNLVFLQADQIAAEPRINLISIDSNGKENITNGYNKRW